MVRRPVQALYQAVSGDAGDAFAPTARVKGNVALGLIPLVARQGSFAMLQALHQATLAEKKPAAYGWLGPQMVVYVQDPKPVFSVADSNATRAGPDTRGPFGGLERIFGDNILTLTGPSWKLHRAFVKSRLTSAQAVEEAYRCVRAVAREHVSALPPTVVLSHLCTLYTLDAVGKSMRCSSACNTTSYMPCARCCRAAR